MRTYARCLAPVLLAVAGLIGGAALVSAQSSSFPANVAPNAPAAPLTCVDGPQPSGAVYRICLPASGWNGDLVVYAHAYVAPDKPVGLPEDQLKVGGVVIADVVTQAGYAFAATSYRRNGLAVREGVDDLVELIDVFSQIYGPPRRVILTGVSEGGAIAALALEAHPDVFDGGLALCGPYGNFQSQVDYLTGFRAVFDFYFPGLMPPTPIDVPPALLSTWETNYYSETVKPVITAPSSALSVTQILSATGAAVDLALPATTEQTFERLLWYNVFSTNDGKQQLGGNPYDNSTHVYTGTLDNTALNKDIFRTTADITATLAISNGYQTTGHVRVPLIMMHTSGDPVIPYWQAALYEQKVAAAKTAPYFNSIRIDRYGHCSFSAFEVLTQFQEIAKKVNEGKVYLPAVLKSEN